VARAAGVARVLVACDDDNLASRRLIERSGAELENIVKSQRDDVLVRRYWIN
jgi:predicted acetyltransferase